MALSLVDLQPYLYRCVQDADRSGASALLDQAVAGSGYRRTISDLLEPTLRRIGERFAQDRLTLAQGYVAGKIAEDFLGKLEAAGGDGRGERRERGTVVLGNAEDDYHALGRRMVGTFLRVEGWTVEDLGNDVLPGVFLDAAERTGARVIGVSAMMLTNALNIAQVREEIERRGLSGTVRLAVGGAIFTLRPELVSEVGADGTAATAMEAPDLFERLAADAGGPA